MRGSSSAPTSRVLDVVELLSRPGRGALRFSDVARELDLTQGTAHAILKTLADRGWITRDPTTKTFALGPALSLIAARLDAERPLAHRARVAARRLAVTLDVPASVVELVGDELLITAFESPAGSTVTAAANERIPYAPPFGVAFAAWDTTSGRRAWLRRGGVSSDQLEARLVELLARTRARGYDVDWMTPALTQAAHAIGTLSAEALPAAMRPMIDQLRTEFASAGLADHARRGPRTVATISAPILDGTGAAPLIVCIHPLRPLMAREIEALAEPLLTEVDSVTSAR